VLLISLLLYMFAHLVPNAVEEGFVILGGCGIIFSALAEPAFSRILRLPVFQFFGRLSYSIYLVHIPILYLLVYLFYQRVPLGWLFIPFVVCVLAASVVFYHLVINPSVHLGRRLAKKLGSKVKAVEKVPVESSPAGYTPQVKGVD
jgi:peptidoglycan/LPS O-acetylase OafA/YrhL